MVGLLAGTGIGLQSPILYPKRPTSVYPKLRDRLTVFRVPFVTATKSGRSVSSTTRSNAKKSSSLVKSTLRPTPRLSTWKTIPPGECRLGRDIHGFLPKISQLCQFGGCHLLTDIIRRSLN